MLLLNAHLHQLLKGVWLSEGHVRAKQVKREKKQGGSTWLRIVLNEGKNREIRRMLARLGHKVLRLRRVAIGPVLLGNLKSGKTRRLSAAELVAAPRGLGFMIQSAAQFLVTDVVVMGIVVIATIAFVLEFIIRRTIVQVTGSDFV